jgi:hypothetical protein
VIPAGRYGYSLVETGAEPGAPGGLRVRPFPRALPVLARRSLPALGLRERPRCGHATILLPRREAEGLVALARSHPDVEVAALVLAEPFRVEEPVPFPLGIRVTRLVPVARGTADDPVHVRIPPAAFAAVDPDPSRRETRAGLAHSHPLGEGRSLFLSSEDKALAAAFFYLPFQIQIVIDTAQEHPEAALAAFAWIDARLVRVCFQIVETVGDPGGNT